MKVGIALSQYRLDDLRPLRIAEIVEDARRAEDAGFDSVWLMDHFFMSRAGVPFSGHEPMVTLAHLAALTTKVQLGVMVLCNNFRHPAQLAREASALADASRSRFILGLGCGSQPAEHETFGLPFRDRVSRLEETLAILRPAAAGEAVTLDGPTIHIRDGRIVSTAPPPPIWLAAFGPRMMRLTAQHADGWVAAWNGPDPTKFKTQLATFRETLQEVGRPPDEVEIVTGILAIPTTPQTMESRLELAQRFGPPGPPLEDRIVFGSPGRIAESVREYWSAGAEHVVLSLTARQFGRFDDGAPSAARDIIRELC